VRIGPAHSLRFCIFVCFVAAVLAVQAANVLLGLHLPATLFSLVPATALLLAATAAISVWRSEALRDRLDRGIHSHGRLLLVLGVLLASSQQLARYADHWVRHLPVALRRQEAEPIAKRLIPEVRKIADRELRVGDWVLTNAPIREFFPSGVRRQEIFLSGKTTGDPGLGGARKEPAAKALLVVAEASDPPPGDLRRYGELSAGQTIYYQGHFYRLKEQVPMIPGFHLLIGDPVAIRNEEDVIYPERFAPKEQVDAYLEWRERNGIPVD
jgi:hypothetical protein